ncbi:MAG: hypothetical protein H0U75_08765 [Legionella sp.]|nr:hypothetical protein [Legionella sp.]
MGVKSEDKKKELERHFLKTTLDFMISASKSEKTLSALEFFEKKIKLPDAGRDLYEAYRDLWCEKLLDTINVLAEEKRKLISLYFVEAPGNGFKLAGGVLRYDIIALKAPVTSPERTKPKASNI